MTAMSCLSAIPNLARLIRGGRSEVLAKQCSFYLPFSPVPRLFSLLQSPIRVMEARHLMKLVLVLCAVALPTLAAAARPAKPDATGFVVRGRVFCDTCRAGFETPATTYLSGAKVKVECRERTTGQVQYSAEGVTDATGTYNIMVANEHEKQICESVLLSSSQPECSQVVPGRDRARVVLAHNNGMPSNVRLANSLGFQQETVMAGCTEIMKMYQLDEEDV